MLPPYPGPVVHGRLVLRAVWSSCGSLVTSHEATAGSPAQPHRRCQAIATALASTSEQRDPRAAGSSLYLACVVAVFMLVWMLADGLTYHPVTS